MMLIHLKTMTVTLALIAGIGLSPTESEHSPRTPEFRAVEIQAEAVLSFGSDDMGVENMKIARASELLNGFRVNEGFLFVRQQFPSACESVENGVFFGERFVEDSGAKLSWST